MPSFITMGSEQEFITPGGWVRLARQERRMAVHSHSYGKILNVIFINSSLNH